MFLRSLMTGIPIWVPLLLSMTISLYHIYKHLSNFHQPRLQLYIVRIILMIPVDFAPNSKQIDILSSSFPQSPVPKAFPLLWRAKRLVNITFWILNGKVTKLMSYTSFFNYWYSTWEMSQWFLSTLRKKYSLPFKNLITLGENAAYVAFD
jgi:hypothetical protein